MDFNDWVLGTVFNDCVHVHLSQSLDPDAETARLRKTQISTIACTCLFEQRQCTDTIVKGAGEEVPRDASGHVRTAGTLEN